jgi:hypothetical protein
MSAIGPKRTSLAAPHMSAFRGEADMHCRAAPLLRSLLGVKRTSPFAAHMSAFDPKRTLSVLLQRLKVRLEPNLRYQGRHDSAADYCREQDSVLLLVDDVIG